MGCFSFCITVSAQTTEVKVLERINPTHPDAFIMKAFTKSAYPVSVAYPVAMLATGFLEQNKNLQKGGWEAVGTLAINTAVTIGMKYTINRSRPYEKYPQLIHPYVIETDPSFPSGHTSTAFATATTMSIQFKRWYVVVPAFAWATGVGYSRLYLGEHYPTDVAAGAVVGAGSAWLSHWLNKKIFK